MTAKLILVSATCVSPKKDREAALLRVEPALQFVLNEFKDAGTVGPTFGC